MAKISAAEVAKLRKMTGAGMMDCKKALSEAEGDFDAAVEVLRKKGRKVANKRADREATEGVVMAKTSDDNKTVYMVSLNCETDFVAKNEDFVNNTEKFLDIAIKNDVADLETLKGLNFSDEKTVQDEVINLTGVIGEKIELSFFAKVQGESTGFYIHSDKKVATIVAMNKAGVDNEVMKDVAMQATAMNPAGLNEKDVPQEVLDKELEIGKELAINEGKPADLADKIARGRLGKFLKENTLVKQAFIKNNKINVEQYLKSVDSDLSVIAFKRFSLRS
ncbi:MAG: translation elongation factor Ts [Bacteroidota bacterium]|nr:translation elongation factor Ts [Bacteroidota bacterium]